MSKKTYEVRSPLHHDGREFAIGKRVELGDDEAAMLLVSGVVVEMSAAPAPVDVAVNEIADDAPAVDAPADAKPKVVDIKAGKNPGNKKK